jgi:hypothetical protein
VDSIPGRDRPFSLHHSVHANSEAHPASCPMGTGSNVARKVTLTTYLHLVPRLTMHSSIHLHGMLLRDNFTYTLILYNRKY